VVLANNALSLKVNGQVRQDSSVDKLIWDIREIIADLSLFYHLQPGDLIYTGTPEGVSPVVSGDHLEGAIDGIGHISLHIGAAA
jgi:fumarylpyruvate hydrolase